MVSHWLGNINLARLGKTKAFGLSCSEASDFQVAHALTAYKQVKRVNTFSVSAALPSVSV